MAIYRFRVIFEDYDEVIREIDMLSKHNFLDFHLAIHQATGYNPELSSSFYVSNDHWKKGEEIAYLPNERKVNAGVTLMEDAKLSKFVNDPHQKFYYTYNFERPFDFHVQLIKILKEEEGVTYPVLVNSIGIVPKPFGAANILSGDAATPTETAKDEFDFLNETEYGIDEEEDYDLLDDEDEEEKDGEGENPSAGFDEEY
jgi:hypothetical protein